MNRPTCLVLCLCLTAASLTAADSRKTPPASGDRAAVTDENVRNAMTAMVGYLYKAANKDGHWEPKDDLNWRKLNEKSKDFTKDANYGGTTALVLNALVSAGQQRDPRFQKACTWLMKQDLGGMYAVGLRMELIHRLSNNAQYRSVLSRDFRHIMSCAIRQPHWITWTYLPGHEHEYQKSQGKGDYSNTNYAILGLWAADAERLEVPNAFWTAIEGSWATGQQNDGGWAYQHRQYPGFTWDNHDKSAGTMTAAGIASLYIVIDSFHARRGAMGSHRNTPAFRSIQKGLEWMDKNFSATKCAARKNVSGYYYYNCERVGKAAGLKYFGQHDWFRGIAANILRNLNSDGGIDFTDDGKPSGKSSVTETSFCLMFLVSGSAPVIANKLQHDGDWDNYTTDLSALSDWIGGTSERPANWQTVSLVKGAEELTDSRMLYISGAATLKLDDRQKAILKRFVELGGTLVFHPDMPNGAMAQSAQKVLAELWPQLELTHVDLQTHPLGRIQYLLKSPLLRVRQLATPNRVLAFVLDCAPGRIWRMHQASTQREFYELGANLHYFVTDRARLDELPTKVTLFAEPFMGPQPATTKTLTLARIRHDESPLRWDPEPLAFERFARLLARRTGIGCEIKVMTVAELAASDVKLAHLTGNAPLKLSDADSQALKGWLASGGTLLVDQAGGQTAEERSESFDASFRRIASQWYPGFAGFSRAPSMDPLMTALGKLDYRNLAGARQSEMVPTLWVAREGARTALVYSPHDLTCALLDCPNPLVSGATAEAAYTIVSHVLLQAAGIDVPQEQAAK